MATQIMFKPAPKRLLLQGDAHQVPGRPPDSAKPSSMRSSTNETGPRTSDMHEATTPQVMLMNASHAGPPNLHRGSDRGGQAAQVRCC